MQDSSTPPAGGSPRHPFEAAADSPHRILVVDDDSMILRLNAELLLRSGYVVETAQDGADAWDMLGADGFDLMITDHNMPRVSGVDLMIRMHGARMALPVILATGAYPHAELARCPWLRPSATLLKPYTAEAMLETVKDVLCRATVACGDVTPVRSWQAEDSSGGMRL